VKVFPAAALIFAVGLLDDLVGLRPSQKLVGQLIAAGWAYWCGVRVIGAISYTTDNWLALPLTLFWLVLCTNAFNLIDGVDGLATGVALFGTLTTLAAAIMQQNLPLVVVTLPLAGFLLGFLRYNFNPATVFLGDSGSLLLGFLLGCFGVIWSQKSATLLGMTAPLMAMFVPLLDVGLSVVRRFLRRQPIFGADRGHIHHRLLDLGLTPRRAVLLLYAVCSLGAVFSLLQTIARHQFNGIIVLLFCGAAWIGVQHLGYVEFNLASRMLLGGSFRRMLDMQIRLRGFEQALAATTTIDDCRRVVTEACRNFGFSSVVVNFQDQIFREDFPGKEIEARWTVRIPLPDGGYVNMMQSFDLPEQSVFPALLVAILRTRLPEKLAALASDPQRQQMIDREIAAVDEMIA
jgi:UDP-GlcNAc:undecaprenyl-phosphate GlcNAc-1-phosphate transferase